MQYLFEYTVKTNMRMTVSFRYFMWFVASQTTEVEVKNANFCAD